MGPTVRVVSREKLLRFWRLFQCHEAEILGGTGLALLVAIWELAARWHWVNPIVLSSPSQITIAFQHQWASGALHRSLVVSGLEFAVGFGLAVIGGLIAGLAMGLNQDIEYALDPFVWFFSSAPLVAFYPLLIVWLGFGLRTVAAISFLLSVVPITVNTLAGMRSVNPTLVRAVRAFGGGSLDVVIKVVLPGSLPLVLAGLRIGVGRALVGIVLGEMFSANAGLGFLISYYGAHLRTSDLFVPLAVIMVFGVGVMQAIRLVEHRIARWRAI